MSYESKINDLQKMIEASSSDEERSSLEAAADAMAFVKAIHNNLAEASGKDPDEEEPNCSALEHMYDDTHGQLAAAVMFLSDPSFAEIPTLFRSISESIDNHEQAKSSPAMNTIPFAIRDGFKNLANSIERARARISQLTMDKVEPTVDG